MNARAVLALAAVAVVIGVVVVVASQDDTRGSNDASASLEPAPTGEDVVAVPADWSGVDTVSPSSKFDATYGAGALSVQVVDDRVAVDVVSRPHDPDVSVRCGYGPNRHADPNLRRVRTSAGGTGSSVSFGAPPFFEASATTAQPQPWASKLAPLIARHTVAVPARRVAQLVANPTVPVTLVRWRHEFDNGLGLTGRLKGSLRNGFDYQLRSDDVPSVGMNSGSIGCHGGSIALFGDGVTYYAFFVPHGQHVTVDGERIRDLQPEPYLQGSWAVVDVARGAKSPKVVFLDADGNRLYTRTTFEFVPKSRQ